MKIKIKSHKHASALAEHLATKGNIVTLTNNGKSTTIHAIKPTKKQPKAN